MTDLWGVWLPFQDDWMRTLQGDYIQVYDDRDRAEEIAQNFPKVVGLEAEVWRISVSPPPPADPPPTATPPANMISERVWSVEQWVKQAKLALYTYWREADGHTEIIDVQKGDGPINLGLSGSKDGTIIVRGPGWASAQRTGSGHGDAVRQDEGGGSAYRYGDGDGDAHRKGSGHGNAVRDGDGIGGAYRCGGGNGDALRRNSGTGSGIAELGDSHA